MRLGTHWLAKQKEKEYFSTSTSNCVSDHSSATHDGIQLHVERLEFQVFNHLTLVCRLLLSEDISVRALMQIPLCGPIRDLSDGPGILTWVNMLRT